MALKVLTAPNNHGWVPVHRGVLGHRVYVDGRMNEAQTEEALHLVEGRLLTKEWRVPTVARIDLLLTEDFKKALIVFTFDNRDNHMQIFEHTFGKPDELPGGETRR